MSRQATTATKPAPYRHADGSNCWTKNCSRDNPVADFTSFLKWAGQANLAETVKHDEAAMVKQFLPTNRIRKGAENYLTEDASRHDEFERARTGMPEEEWQAVNHYMQYGYGKVNAYLRGGNAWQNFLKEDHHEKVEQWGYKDWSAEKLEQEADELINKLDRAFKKVHDMYPAGDQQLYRYETVPAGDTLDALKERYKPGTTVDMPAYTSTSRNPNLIISMTNKDWMKDKEIVVFEIISHRGIDLHTAFGNDGGVTAEEQEVLLPRSTKLKVHKIIEAPYQTGYTPRVQERLGYYGYRDNWKKPVTKKRFTIIQLIDVTD